MTSKYEHWLVRKSRPLLEMMNDNFVLGELKILDLYLSKINPQKPETAKMTISVEEYCRLMGIDSGRIRPKQLKRYLSNFLTKVVTLPYGDHPDSFVQAVLFTTAIYDAEKKEISL